MKKLIFIFVLFGSLNAQTIEWTNITGNYLLPNSIQVFEGTRSNPNLKIWYMKIDMNDPNIAVRPYISGTNKTLPNFTNDVGAYAAVNGGFFGGSTSYSAVVYPNEVKAENVPAVTRNSQSYPLIRSFFGMDFSRNLSVDWIYHFGNSVEDIYNFQEPLQYVFNDPAPKSAPSKTNGTPYDGLLVGIGGAPTLVKNGQVNITYNEEIMWGSGVGNTNTDPRTAVGYTADNHVIMITADGRQSASVGVSLPELAQIMIDLGCVEAMNLDGGGSTQMAIGNSYLNSPSEQRPVPTILAVVHSDSLNLPKEPTYEKIIDTSDPDAEEGGSGWFPSANSGFYGGTPSLLNAIGDGSNFYRFNANLPAEAEYEVYGWWVSSSNRCADTPFIISHKDGTDTVRVDQTKNSSQWVYIGKYNFNGNENDIVDVSNAGTTNLYVVADAVRFITYDDISVDVKDEIVSLPSNFLLKQNYPNPFNPTTSIEYSVISSEFVTLKVYDILGNEITTLVNEQKSSGNYKVDFKGDNLTSGIYIITMNTGRFTQSIKAQLIK